MKRFLKYAVLTLMWAAVAGYVGWSAASSRSARAKRKVQRVQIEIADSTSQGHLVSVPMVRGWIRSSGIPTVGTAVDKVDLSGLEQLVARNGFVDEVSAYVTYNGGLYIDISQREPLLRLLTDGVNSYVTDRGYVFAAPRSSSLYVPVVSGSYRPPFAAGYSGSVREHIDAGKRKIDERIQEIEREKYPLFRREIQNDKNISELRRMRIKKQWWKLESDEEFDKRVVVLREKKAALRRRYRYEARLIQEGIEKVAARQQAERLKQKKLEKSYEDFMKLLTFVEQVEDDKLWSSEVVQIVAHTAPSGALEVELVPRSGRHTILFGRLERVDEKFEKLLGFYRSGLTSFGWDEYKTIDIRYNDQVVCRK